MNFSKRYPIEIIAGTTNYSVEICYFVIIEVYHVGTALRI